MTASPSASSFTLRHATEPDLPALKFVMNLAIEELQRGFLTDQEIVASRAVMGLDTQLVADRTYFVIEHGDTIAGCGGWSRRATLYGGDHSSDLREPRLLNADEEAARIRAMYTHPAFARSGVGRLILQHCEAAALAEGFGHAELMATLAGEPLYRACGYEQIERIEAVVDGIGVPLVRMGKRLAPVAAD
jgi:GNAT superfamily N-acetyltransferase